MRAAQGHDPSGVRGAFGGAEAWAFVSDNLDLRFWGTLHCKLQFPRFKFQTTIQVRVSSCNFRVSSFKQKSRSGFQVAISKFQVSNQDLGQGVKLKFLSFIIQTKIEVRGSSCNFQVSSFKF